MSLTPYGGSPSIVRLFGLVYGEHVIMLRSDAAECLNFMSGGRVSYKDPQKLPAAKRLE